MNNQFVAHGPLQLEHVKAILSSADEIKRKYAVRLEQATPDEKAKIIKQMANELLLREKTLNHKPSSGTLW